MDKTLFVISDLHLGGAEGFQMCSTEGRARLVRFIDWAVEQKRDGDELQLVLNGDIVDFLAEKDEAGGFSAFVIDEDKARRKLTRIAEGCEPVFAALRRFAIAGNWLTLLIGNHDVELSLPSVADFLSVLGEGHIEYLYDNEAYTIGPVLIEHGNRYDAWNMVNHGELRQVRSRLSARSTRQVLRTAGQRTRGACHEPGQNEIHLRRPAQARDWRRGTDLGGARPRAVAGGGYRDARRAAAWYRGQFKNEGAPERGDYVAAAASAQTATTEITVLPEGLRAWLDAADAAAADALPHSGEVGRLKVVAVAGYSRRSAPGAARRTGPSVWSTKTTSTSRRRGLMRSAFALSVLATHTSPNASTSGAARSISTPALGRM